MKTMENNAALAKPQAARLPQIKKLCTAAIFAVLGALLQIAAIGEDKRIFALALLIACPEPYPLSVMIGGLVTYRLSAVSATHAAYLAACGVVCSVRWLVTGFKAGQERAGYICGYIAACASLSLTRITVAALLGSLKFKVFSSLLFELLLLFVFSFAFRRCGELVFLKKLGLNELINLICCGLSAAVFCAAACKISMSFLSLGHIVAVFLSLCFCFLFDGTSCLPLVGFVCAGCLLSEQSYAFAAAAITLCSSVATALRSRGKGAFMISFLLPAAVFSALAPSGVYAAIYLSELFIGALLFAALPVQKLSFKRKPENIAYKQAAAAACEKLSAASDTMQDISTLLGAPTEDNVANSAGELFASCIEKVCRGCKNMPYCWLKNYDTTFSRFSAAAKMLIGGEQLDRAALTRLFCGQCISIGALSDSMNDSYDRFLQNRKASRSARVCREMLAGQFSAISAVLLATKAELNRLCCYDERRGRLILECAADISPQVTGAFCSAGENPTASVTFSDEPTEEQTNKIARCIGRIVGKSVTPSPAKKAPLGWRVSFRQKGCFTLETAAMQHSASRSGCGDVYSVMDGSDCGIKHLLLCDGMGHGSAAARDGAFSCALMEKLIASGLDISACTGLLNAAFSLRTDTESACTMDLLRFDEQSGLATLYKAGAADTFIVKDRQIKRLSGRTLPIGILDNVFSQSCEITLSPGDLVVMISDGLDSSSDEIAAVLKSAAAMPADEICRKIMESAKKSPLRDDATVIAARVKAA